MRKEKLLRSNVDIVHGHRCVRVNKVSSRRQPTDLFSRAYNRPGQGSRETLEDEGKAANYP